MARQGVERRLAAIRRADVVVYSLLMAADRTGDAYPAEPVVTEARYSVGT